MKFSLIIPAKNEEKRILLPLLEYYHALYRKFGEKQFEIQIVVNNSNDYTARVARSIKKSLNSKEIIIHDIGETEGKGRAVMYGIKHSKGDYIAFTDADGSYRARDILLMLRKLTLSGADAIIPNRYHQESVLKGDISLLRRVFSRTFNFFSRLLFLIPFSDTQGGMKILKKNAVKSLLNSISTFGWIFDLNMIISLRNHNYKIIETPVTWMQKNGSQLSIVGSSLSIAKDFILLLRKQYIERPIIKVFNKEI